MRVQKEPCSESGGAPFFPALALQDSGPAVVWRFLSYWCSKSSFSVPAPTITEGPRNFPLHRLLGELQSAPTLFCLHCVLFFYRLQFLVFGPLSSQLLFVINPFLCLGGGMQTSPLRPLMTPTLAPAVVHEIMASKAFSAARAGFPAQPSVPRPWARFGLIDTRFRKRDKERWLRLLCLKDTALCKCLPVPETKCSVSSRALLWDPLGGTVQPWLTRVLRKGQGDGGGGL